VTKTALVTGGNRGIGFEISKGLAQQGMQVLLAGRTAEIAQDAVTNIGLPNVFPVQLDLSEQTEIASQVASIENACGNVDVLINNAGILVSESLSQVAIKDVLYSFQVNTFAALELMQLVLPSMQKCGYGRIVNLSSGWGSFYEGMEGPIAYSASKAALNAITMNAARQTQGDIKINAMCPGWVHTRMGGKDAPRTPQQGADTAIWLANLDSDGPSGQFFRERTPIHW
jgi:NAD(P)-dependent dehydrogenase (short-subunit alcohol dehydrogenase family)